MEMREGDLHLTDDPDVVDVHFVESMLRTSYWAADRPRAAIEASIRTSVPVSLFRDGQQVGFARIVSDWVTFAWIADVVVDPSERGRGLGRRLMRFVMDHPSVSGTTQQLLRTHDAHGLYERYGFEVAECMARRGTNKQ